MRIAPIRRSTSLSNTESKSRALLTCCGRASNPSARDASCASCDIAWASRLFGFHEHGDRGSIWNQVTQDCQLLARNPGGEKADTRDMAVWPTDAGDESGFDRVAASGKDNRYCRGCSFCGKRRRRAPACENNGNLTIDQLGRQGGKPIGTLVRPSIFDGN